MRKIIFTIIAFFLFCCASNKQENLTENPAEIISEQTMNIDMVFVKGGTFAMGCFGTERFECLYEIREGLPAHDVSLSDFYISKYLVTQKLWKNVMGTDKVSEWIHGEGNDYPVYNVSWHEAQEFIEKLNSLTGKKYRLPTEAEWEYAARGGAESKGYKYAGSNDYSEVAHETVGISTSYMSTSTGSSHSKIHTIYHYTYIQERKNCNLVGTKKPNELGIYDMSGNVDEWTLDWGDEYSSAPQINPKGPLSGDERITRGSNYVYDRGSDVPDKKAAFIGFRLAMEI